MIAFWGSTEAETLIEHTTDSTVVDVDEEPVAPETLNLKGLLLAQRNGKVCRERSESAGDPNSCFDYHGYVILVRKAKLDGSLQRVVPEPFRHQPLRLAHYPVAAVHLGGIPT